MVLKKVLGEGKKKKNYYNKKDHEALDQAEKSDKGDKFSFRVIDLQIKPDKKVNHLKTMTQQKYEIDRLKLENLELQTSE